MPYESSIGAVRFELDRTGTAPVPTLHGHPVTTVEDLPLLGVREGEHLYLLLDHRAADDRERSAYVEFWRPAPPAEGPLSGLFVLTSARPGQRPVGATPASLSSLALLLSSVAAERPPGAAV